VWLGEEPRQGYPRGIQETEEDVMLTYSYAYQRWHQVGFYNSRRAYSYREKPCKTVQKWRDSLPGGKRFMGRRREEEGEKEKEKDSVVE
jgi:hypothetical protein